MITTIYKCDKCGHEQNKSDQMWTLEVGYRHHNSNVEFMPVMVSALWCRSCVEGIGFLTTVVPGKKSEEKPIPTIEELILDIVKKEIEDIRN